MSKFFFTQLTNLEMFVKSGRPWGGSVVQTYHWMLALHGLDQEIFLAKNQEDQRELKDKYKWLKLIPFFESNKFKGKAVWFSYRFPSIFRALKGVKPDYVYTSIVSWRTLYVCIICKLLGIKHILRIANDPDVDKSLLVDFPKLFEIQIDLTFKLSDFILAQNNFQLQVLKNKSPKTKLVKIANPIILNGDYLEPKTKVIGYFAWLANFRYQKNLSLLYKIAINFPKENFKIAGQPLFPLDKETAEYYERLKELPNVEFVGILGRHQVLPFLKDAKFLLNTSRYEGFSNTFLESMMVGTPILSTPAVNPDKIINEFDLGSIYKDADDLAKILGEITNADYYEKSNNCIAYLKEYHDHIKLGEKLLAFLNNPSSQQE